MKKQQITVLWLDDMRDPINYLKKKVTKDSGALYNNIQFYTDFLKKYNPEFIWVRTFEEFTDYIMKNGLPDFVSFDHDLGKGVRKGAECAAWLKEYCKENGLQLPKYYAHSANPNGRNEINAAMMNEKVVKLTMEDLNEMIRRVVSTLNEDVFADKSMLDKKKKTIGLTYNQNGGTRNKGNLTSADMLGTDKMDADNEDTYEVTLKGGIKSYNITSIKGESIMHYFKNKFAKKGNSATIKAGGDEYELMMEEPEFQKFMNVFNKKVNRVVNYCINEFRQEGNDFEPNKVSIYPVPSSSDFNKTMAGIMSHMTLGGLPVRVASVEILKKDLRNLKRDENFIEKNRNYFYGKMSDQSTQNGFDKPVSSFLDRDINKFGAINDAKKYVEEMNVAVGKILSAWQNYKQTNSEKTLKTLVTNYMKYYDAMKSCVNKVTYENPLKGEGEDSSFMMDTVAKALKYTKGPSVEGRSGFIWDLVKPFLRGKKCPITGKPYVKADINKWEPQKFQIKNLSNGERMGLRNFYNPNEDLEFVQNELNEIKGGVLVIFDDNISGGATLSDVCYQFKEMGVEYLIPITFGQMSTKWTMNMIPLSKPRNDQGAEDFNY